MAKKAKRPLKGGDREVTWESMRKTRADIVAIERRVQEIERTGGMDAAALQEAMTSIKAIEARLNATSSIASE